MTIPGEGSSSDVDESGSPREDVIALSSEADVDSWVPSTGGLDVDAKWRDFLASSSNRMADSIANGVVAIIEDSGLTMDVLGDVVSMGGGDCLVEEDVGGTDDGG